MVRLRLKRTGRTHRPFYRIVAIDIRTRRDGAPIEEIGRYDPLEKDPTKQVVLDTARAQHWLDVGAQPSETVEKLLAKAGVKRGAAPAAATA